MTDRDNPGAPSSPYRDARDLTSGTSWHTVGDIAAGRGWRTREDLTDKAKGSGHDD